MSDIEKLVRAAEKIARDGGGLVLLVEAWSHEKIQPWHFARLAALAGVTQPFDQVEFIWALARRPYLVKGIAS